MRKNVSAHVMSEMYNVTDEKESRLDNLKIFFVFIVVSFIEHGTKARCVPSTTLECGFYWSNPDPKEPVFCDYLAKEYRI